MKVQEFYNENERIAVVTTEPFARLLDYLAPEGGCKIGSFLILPLGKRKVMGVVWGSGDGQYDHSKLRNAISVIDAPPMSFSMRKAVISLGPADTSVFAYTTRVSASGPLVIHIFDPFSK